MSLQAGQSLTQLMNIKPLWGNFISPATAVMLSTDSSPGLLFTPSVKLLLPRGTSRVLQSCAAHCRNWKSMCDALTWYSHLHVLRGNMNILSKWCGADFQCTRCNNNFLYCNTRRWECVKNKKQTQVAPNLCQVVKVENQLEPRLRKEREEIHIQHFCVESQPSKNQPLTWRLTV